MAPVQDPDRHRWQQARIVVGLACIVCTMTPGILARAAQHKTATFSQLAEKARKASDENRLDEAAALYTQALALRPLWKEGWWSLGTLEYDQDHYAKAAQDFKRLIALDPANGSAHAMLGLCQFELSQDEPALKNLLKAEQLGVIRDEQLRKVALYHMGVLELRARKFDDAKETLDQLARLHVETKELTAALGLAVLLISPKDVPPEGTPGREVVRRIGQAEALVAAKKFDEARKAYGDLVSEYPDFPNIQYAYGRCLLDLSDVDAAVAAFQREIQNSPRNIPARLQIAAARYRLDSADGIKYAKEAVELAPQEPFGHYLLGLLYLDTGDYYRAISELEISKRVYANVPDLYFALGNAYARAGRKEEAAQARATFKRLSAENKKNTIDLNKGEQP